ncbi:hypothetical protein [Variovorax sp. PCZ-1]|uniref:hypothetical protein n=1 Tax=Variovorax sp. PCZ-1 TaxID=2835533 RepID=UPI001BD121A4|nr:hypothetical protein [Variovorax sp. PCZ-1]MBS7807881.1 hypothetical protein [Variovorax sp. PCZ-1]
MNPLFLQTTLACALTCMSLSASAVGRIADVNVIDRSTGQTLPVHLHRGEYWVAGQPGAKYSIQIRNSRGSRVLAVTSVDGLNVLSGEAADFSQSGYVFESGQRYGIEGWRKSDSQVAAFVFTASGDSYAERIGKPRDMGVIGVALFREKPAAALHPHPPVVSRRELPSPAAPSEQNSRANSSSDKASSSMERERSASSMPAPLPTPKLGTAHGERETSVVSRTQFERNSAQPDEIIRIRYDSHANLIAQGVIPSPRPRYLHAPDPFPGSPLGYVPDPPTYR